MLTADGDTVESGELVTDINPGDTAIVKIPFHQYEGEELHDWRLVLSFRQKENNPWAKPDLKLPLSSLKFRVSESRRKKESLQIPSCHHMEAADSLIVKGNDFEYTFDRKAGVLKSMRCFGKEVIHRGPDLNVWRAPLANETDQWGSSSSGTTHWGEGYGHFAATDWYSTGLDNLHRILESFRYRKT